TLQRDAQRLQRLGGDALTPALTLVDEPEQDVLGPDVVVVEHPGLFLGQDQRSSGSVSESLEHVPPSPISYPNGRAMRTYRSRSPSARRSPSGGADRLAPGARPVPSSPTGRSGLSA